MVVDVPGSHLRHDCFGSRRGHTALLKSSSSPALPYCYSYEVLCEFMDAVAGTSAHLCRLMGLPVREVKPGKPTEEEEEEAPVAPSSPGEPAMHVHCIYCTLIPHAYMYIPLY